MSSKVPACAVPAPDDSTVAELMRQVDQLRSELRATSLEVDELRNDFGLLRDQIASEVRTKRIVVVDDNGEERGHLKAANDGAILAIWNDTGTSVSMSAGRAPNDGELEAACVDVCVDGGRGVGEAVYSMRAVLTSDDQAVTDFYHVDRNEMVLDSAESVRMLGQYVGGLLGTGTVATDQVGRVMYQRAQELRQHITARIGWPAAAPIDD